MHYPTFRNSDIKFKITNFGLLKKKFNFESVLERFETARYALGALADTEPVMERYSQFEPQNVFSGDFSKVRSL